MLSKRIIAAMALTPAAGLALWMAAPRGLAVAQENQQNEISSVLERKLPVRFVPGDIIVRHRATVGPLAAGQMVPLGLERVEQSRPGLTVYRLTQTVIGAMGAQARVDRTNAAVEELRKRPDVEFAQPNYLYRIVQTTPNDPEFKNQWHYMPNGTGPGNSPGGIGLPIVWNTNKGKDTVVVAVIDTGILPNHPDISGSPNRLPGFDMISNPAVANDGDGRDSDPTDPGDAVVENECGFGAPADPSSWHGSHVSGTVGVGNTDNKVGVAGVNWAVKILPVRVLGKCGGSTLDIIDAIRWSAGMTVPGVPANPNKARVINMSLGGPQPCLGPNGDPAMQDAINEVFKAGVTVVVAAGNEAMDASQSTPGGCNNVITVAASDFRGHFVDRYSNFGKSVEIMAPGGDVRRDDNNDSKPDGVLSMVQGGFAFYNGTSMAAPHVAGVAALLLACNATLTPPQILQKIQSTARPRTTAQGCPAGKCGAGLLDAVAAVKSTCSGT
jgi:serine protease